jgi:hypothetical protein
MPITLKMEPETAPVLWTTFCNRYPPFSIALDGFVAGGPKFDPKGPHINFNHHERVDRMSTRATCSQVLVAIRQGLFDCFKPQKTIAWADDCDEDVCLAVFLLRHPQMVAQVMNQRLNRLVSIEGLLDSTAGAYPFPKNLPALEELAWVFKPYRDFRLSGQIENRDADEFAEIVDVVGGRISRYLRRDNGRIPLDTRYERIGGGKDWTMIREIGAQGRTGAFADGIRAYMSVRNRPDNNHTVTIGRMSIFINFATWNICRHLNELEGTTRSADRWGGADNIIGSPRYAGTKLSLDAIARVIERYKHT